MSFLRQDKILDGKGDRVQLRRVGGPFMWPMLIQLVGTPRVEMVCRGMRALK